MSCTYIRNYILIYTDDVKGSFKHMQFFQIREQAIMASAYLCVGDANFLYKVDVLESLLKLSKEVYN